VKLAGELEGFRARGLGLAAVSYDSVELLADFATRKSIPFPLLSDPDSTIIERFGLLHPDYPEGHRWHGLPYPGTIVMDAKGIVRAKYFEEGYQPRRTAASVLVLEGDSGAGEQTIQTDHFVLRTSVSDGDAYPGNRITLVLDFEMTDGRHAYAPGAAKYRVLNLELERSPRFEPEETVYPEAQTFHFEPLDETVPVFEGRFRLLQDVTLATGKEINALAASSDATLTLTGTLGYQVCSDKVCFPPDTLALSWSVRLLPMEMERVPEALRRK